MAAVPVAAVGEVFAVCLGHTANSWSPVVTEDGKELPHWVSRFDIYPYLERYAEVCITLFIPCLSFQKKIYIHSLLTGIVYAFISSNSIIYSFLFGTG